MTTEIPNLALGFCEQAVAGGDDPFFPALSISHHGNLAKWGAKVQFVDLRVNDPGLRHYRAGCTAFLERCASHGVDVVLGLPQYEPGPFPALPDLETALAPEPRQPTKGRPQAKSRGPRFSSGKIPRPIHHRPAWLAIPDTWPNRSRIRELSLEDVLPIIELGRKYNVNTLVVGVTAPGQFIETNAFESFQNKLKTILDAAWGTEESPAMRVLVRTGGLSPEGFNRLRTRTALKFGKRSVPRLELALDVGASFLEEGDDFMSLYRSLRPHIPLLVLQQVMPAREAWHERVDNRHATAEYLLKAVKNYHRKEQAGDRELLGEAASKLVDAWEEFRKSRTTAETCLGIFQNGAINFAPLLKELRADLEHGHTRRVSFYTAPHLRNFEHLMRYLGNDALPRL